MTELTKEDFEAIDGNREETLGVEKEQEKTVEEKAEVKPSVFDGDDFPEELRGKTPEEAAALFNQIKNAGKEMAKLAMSRVQAPPVAAQPPAEIEPPPKITPDDLLSEDSDINEKIGRIAEYKIQPFVKQAQQAAAKSTYDAAFQANPYLEDFRQEIDQIITARQLTHEQMADPRTMALIDAHILKSHGKEIYEKYAAPKEKPKPPDSERGGGPRRAPESENKLTPEQRNFAKLLGADVSEAELFADYIQEK